MFIKTYLIGDVDEDDPEAVLAVVYENNKSIDTFTGSDEREAVKKVQQKYPKAKLKTVG